MARASPSAECAVIAVGIACAAVLLDRLLGEPRRWHPLIGFGRVAVGIERYLNRGTRARRLAGIAAMFVIVTPVVWFAAWTSTGPFAAIAAVLWLYLALGARSLGEHALAVQEALKADELPAARAAVGRIVSRETQTLDAGGVARATVESVLENGSDAVFGSLFWFFVAGAPGAVLHRLVNTLDAMWGYRTERYRDFGWAAARFDDALNWLPARLTALTYALLGRTRAALRCWRIQAPQWYSPNAGPVMAAGAGALGVELGGAACYHGALKARPRLGAGREPQASDIVRAVSLVRNGVWLWLALALFAAGGSSLA
jgi:adenosylcobinamide-phosphate synthase